MLSAHIKVSKTRALVEVNKLIEANQFPEALNYLNTKTDRNSEQLKTLYTLLRRRPEQRGKALFQDDPRLDIQIVPKAGLLRKPIIFVLMGRGQRFGAPLNLINCWFQRLDSHIVYVRDFNDLYYLNGVKSCGGYRQTLEKMNTIARTLKATSVHFAGNSGGGFGALNLALDLNAHSVLCFAGQTRIDRSAATVLESWQTKVDPNGEPPKHLLDPSTRYRDAPRIPRVRMIFGERHEQDRQEAHNLGGLENVELYPLKNHNRHAVLAKLAKKSDLLRTLKWIAPQGHMRRRALNTEEKLLGIFNQT